MNAVRKTDRSNARDDNKDNFRTALSLACAFFRSDIALKPTATVRFIKRESSEIFSMNLEFSIFPCLKKSTKR